jgi:hypothetical protein
MKNWSRNIYRKKVASIQEFYGDPIRPESMNVGEIATLLWVFHNSIEPKSHCVRAVRPRSRLFRLRDRL